MFFFNFEGGIEKRVTSGSSTTEWGWIRICLRDNFLPVITCKCAFFILNIAAFVNASRVEFSASEKADRISSLSEANVHPVD